MRFILKILVLPLFVFVTLAKWFGMFMNSFAAIILRITAFLIFLLAIFGLFVPSITFGDVILLVLTAFVLYMIPVFGGSVVYGLTMLQQNLKEMLQS